MKRIVSFSCLVWLVCISVVASEQTADHHHHDEDSTAMKGVDSALKETRGNAEGEGKKNGKLAGFNMWDVPSTNLQERGMKSNYDSSIESGSFEDGGIQDRGLFDMFDSPSPGRQRRRRGGMFSPVPYGRGGYGRGRGGRSPYNQQPYADPRYDAGMGYGSGGPYGYGGSRRFPQGGQYQLGPYSNRLGQYQGGRGGRMGSPRYGGYPGAGGYLDQQSYRQPYYRDLPTESNTPAEPVVA